MAESVPAGQDAQRPSIGDFILVNRQGVVPGLIRLGQWLRPSQRPWARFSHVACIATPDGELIEALTRGVVRSPLSDYRDVSYVLVRAGLDEHDQAQALAFLQSCIGQRYGFLTDIGIALRFLTPGRGLWFGADGTQICSGMAAQMLVRGTANFKSNPASMAPAELGAYYRVP